MAGIPAAKRGCPPVSEDGAENTVGEWLGMFEGSRVRDASEDVAPVIELHGEDGIAAIEANEHIVRGLTEAAAELNMALEEADRDD